MEELHIPKNKNSLNVDCTRGRISMEGNSILPNPSKFYDPVDKWITRYIKDPADETEVHLKFYHIDTASVQSVFNVIKKLKEIPEYFSRVKVNWYFEFDDPELLEVGEIMESRLGMDFNFIEFSRVDD